jgi:hypothetical protein
MSAKKSRPVEDRAALGARGLTGASLAGEGRAAAGQSHAEESTGLRLLPVHLEGRSTKNERRSV